MRRSLLIAAAVLAAISWVSSASADRKQPPNNPQQPIGNNPHPIAQPTRPPPPIATKPHPVREPIRPQQPVATKPHPVPTGPTNPKPVRPAPKSPSKNAGAARRPNDRDTARHPARSRDDDRRDRFADRIGYRHYPRAYLYRPFGYSDYYGYGDFYDYGWPNGYDPYYYYYPYGAMPLPAALPIIPGLAAPAPRGFANNNDGVPPPPEPGDDEPRKIVTRSTSAHASATAWKYIGYGDALFAKQRYAEAGDRYRRAASTAPQLADAWFRRALALTANKNYELAVTSIKRGLALDPKWPRVTFDATDTLWADADAKEEYLAKLAKLAAENPADPDINFLVGVHFHVDGQEKQARKYFDRALRIAGPNSEHIAAFFNGAL